MSAQLRATLVSAVHRTWLRDREAVIRRALQEHGGPFLVIAITQTHTLGWWDCDGSGHRGLPCSGATRLQGQGPTFVERRE